MDISQTTLNPWKQIKVEDIAIKIHYGFTASSTKKNTGVKFLRITDIQEYKVDWYNVPFCEIDEYDLHKYLLHEGDIVFARTGATVGKSFLITGEIPNAIFASYLIRIKLSKKINPKYIFYFFQSADYWRQIGIRSIGIGQPNVNASGLGKITLPLAPIKEQNRIVLKIEELLTELDQAHKSLIRATRLLEIQRQSLLRNAFTGKLTEKWRSENDSIQANDFIRYIQTLKAETYRLELATWNDAKNKGKDPFLAKPKPNEDVIPLTKEEVNELDQLPERWNWTKLDSVTSITMGQSPAGTSYNEKGVGVPLINGPVEFGPSPFSTTLLTKWTTAPTKFCEAGDLILCIRGSTTGRQNISGFKACLGRGVAGIRAIGINQKYVNHFFSYSRRKIFELGTGTTFPNVSYNQLKDFPIPICSFEEQDQIVQEIEYKTTIIDNLELNINQNITRVEAFRLAVLKAAFEGRLSSNESDDDSIDKLLESIKYEQIEFIANEKILSKTRPKRVKNMEQQKGILEVLKENNGSLSTRELWLRNTTAPAEVKIDLFLSTTILLLAS